MLCASTVFNTNYMTNPQYSVDCLSGHIYRFIVQILLDNVCDTLNWCHTTELDIIFQYDIVCLISCKEPNHNLIYMKRKTYAHTSHCYLQKCRNSNLHNKEKSILCFGYHSFFYIRVLIFSLSFYPLTLHFLKVVCSHSYFVHLRSILSYSKKY